MIDHLLTSDAERWRSELPPEPDLEAAVARAVEPHNWRRVVLPLVAATVIVGLALGLTIGLASSATRPPSASHSQHSVSSAYSSITDVTWTATTAPLTVVYTDDRIARLSDGCGGGNQRVRAQGDTLTLDMAITEGFTCGGLPLSPDPAARRRQARQNAELARLRHVVDGPSRWRRGGERLVLSNTRYGTAVFTAGRSDAPRLLGSRWTLQQDDLPSGYRTATGSLVVAADGRFTAVTDCDTITGTVVDTDAEHATFQPDASAKPTCATGVTRNPRQVLNGRRKYSLSGRQLVVYGNGSTLLAYSYRGS